MLVISENYLKHTNSDWLATDEIDSPRMKEGKYMDVYSPICVIGFLI
jgi:hypothetical protein